MYIFRLKFALDELNKVKRTFETFITLITQNTHIYIYRYATPLLARWMCTWHRTTATSVRYKVGSSGGIFIYFYDS